jgi:hypothetical protein
MQYSALNLACERGCPMVLNLLLQHNANPNASRQDPALMIPVVDLCTCGFDGEFEGEFIDITFKRTIEIVKLLLRHGAIVGTKNKENQNALEMIGDLLKKDDACFARKFKGKNSRHAILEIADLMKTALNNEIRDKQFDERKEAIKLFEIVNKQCNIIIHIGDVSVAELYMGNLYVLKDILSYL